MKFVLGIIAIVIISLAVYVTMGSNGKQQVQKEVAKAVQPTEEVSQVVPVEGKKRKSSVKNITVKSSQVVSQEPIQEMEEEIGKGLTLEGIENADVSDEEKEVMRNDLVYHQILHTEPSVQPTEDEIIKMITESSLDGKI